MAEKSTVDQQLEALRTENAALKSTNACLTDENAGLREQMGQLADLRQQLEQLALASAQPVACLPQANSEELMPSFEADSQIVADNGEDSDTNPQSFSAAGCEAGGGEETAEPAVNESEHFQLLNTLAALVDEEAAEIPENFGASREPLFAVNDELAPEKDDTTEEANDDFAAAAFAAKLTSLLETETLNQRGSCRRHYGDRRSV